MSAPASLSAITFEYLPKESAGQCESCGKPRSVLERQMWRGDAPHGVVWLFYTKGHADRSVTARVVLADQTGEPDGTLFEIAFEPTYNSVTFMTPTILDAAGEERELSKLEADIHPRMQDVWDALHQLVAEDAELRAYLRLALSAGPLQ